MRKLVVLFSCCLLAAPASAYADPFADSVVSFAPGANGGFNSASLPGVVTGPPRGAGPFQGSFDVASLGLNSGSITLEFTDNQIVDGPGVDFTVFENSFLTTGAQTNPPFSEPGSVSVSSDGLNWSTFPCQIAQPPYYPGCAGVYPVFANVDVAGAPSPLVPTAAPIQDLVGKPVSGFQAPPGSGGDSFDLANVGLSSARFVRIDSGAANFGLEGKAGFDLDAIAAVNSSVYPPPPSGESIPLFGATAVLSSSSKTQMLIVNAVNQGTEPAYSEQSDPTLAGATLLVRGGDSDKTFVLPAANWKAKTKKDKVTKLKYKTGDFTYKQSKSTPTEIQSASLVKGKLAVSGKGLGLGLDLDPNPVPFQVSIEIGDRTRCAVFGGETKYTVAKGGALKLTAKKAAPPVDCEDQS